MKEIKEVIVVEGKSDKQFLETFIKADFLICNGSAVDGFDKELKFDIGIVPRAARANDDFYYGVQSYITRSKNTASA